MCYKRLDTLETTLKQVIDWLKFAESKNGALVAIGCVVIFGAYRAFSSFSGESDLITVYMISFILFIVASVVVALASFIPRIAPPFWIKMPEKEKGDNPLFFGHACKYSKFTYLELFNNHVEGGESNESKLELALCDQIVNNSKISFIKYQMFGSSVFLFLAGVLTPVGALIFYWVRE
jgi:hypothetical protein